MILGYVPSVIYGAPTADAGAGIDPPPAEQFAAGSGDAMPTDAVLIDAAPIGAGHVVPVPEPGTLGLSIAAIAVSAIIAVRRRVQARPVFHPST